MDILKSRAIQRALADLRCGVPVQLQGVQDWIILPVETASQDSLESWRALCEPPFFLGVGPGPAARLRGEKSQPHDQPMAFPLAETQLTPENLEALASPLVARPQSAMPQQSDAPLDLPDALKLAKLAQLLPAVLIAKTRPLAAEAGLLCVTQQQLADYPQIAAQVRLVAEAQVALHDIGNTRIIAFRPVDGGQEHVAIVIGEPERQQQPLVRVHSACFTGDLLGSLRCDCGPQLHAALKLIASEQHGALLYLAQEGRSIGLPNKLRAYLLQDGAAGRAPLDTLDANQALGWDADERDFSVAASILQALNIARIRLITNNPQKIAVLRACGIDIAGQQPNRIPANGVNNAYLETKRNRLGHTL